MPNALQKIKYMPKICKICQSGNTVHDSSNKHDRSKLREKYQYNSNMLRIPCLRVRMTGCLGHDDKLSRLLNFIDESCGCELSV